MYWDNRQENGNYRDCWEYKHMVLYRDYTGVTLGIYSDNGKEKGNYYITGLYRDYRGFKV